MTAVRKKVRHTEKAGIMPARRSQVVFGITTMASIALVGCGGGQKAADTTTIINQTVMPPSGTVSASAAPALTGAAQPAAAADMPQPPAGATQLETGTENGMAKARYSISGQQPNQVVEYYTNLWKGDGYTIVSSSSGGDGGLHGGAMAVASKNGSFIGVDAGADMGEPTRFEVCQGSDEKAVRDCID